MKTLSDLIVNMFGQNMTDIDIKDAVMDSREISRGSLFFAINKGNEHVKEALEKGASLVICDKYSGPVDKKIIKVNDTIKTMQDIAFEYRKCLGLKVITITGSNGKTTTKDIIYSLLKEKYKVKKTEGNHNNHIGVPYTILQLDENDEVSILELGMSAFGEIDTLTKIAQPNHGVITNIGDSHLEFLKTRANVFKAKGEMIKYLADKDLFVCGDDTYLKDTNGVKVGFGKNNDQQITGYHEDEEGMTFGLNNSEKTYKIKLNGKHNCMNAAMAITIAIAYGLTYDEINKGLATLQITPMRFQKIDCGNIMYINDAYNASPVSMKCSLDTFDKMYNDRKKIAVLGDMLELGDKEIEFHEDVIKDAMACKIDKIYLYGTRMKKALDKLNMQYVGKIEFFTDKKDIKNRICAEKEKIAVLLKASRGMKLEEIL